MTAINDTLWGHLKGLYILFFTEMWERFSYYGMRTLLSFNLVLTIGELYLSPIGLSLVCKLAPVRMVSMLMGVWFMTSAIGAYLAGYLGHFWDLWPKEYFFLMVAGIAGLAGVIILLLLKPLKRAIGEHAGI